MATTKQKQSEFAKFLFGSLVADAELPDEHGMARPVRVKQLPQVGNCRDCVFLGLYQTTKGVVPVCAMLAYGMRTFSANRSDEAGTEHYAACQREVREIVVGLRTSDTAKPRPEWCPLAHGPVLVSAPPAAEPNVELSIVAEAALEADNAVEGDQC